MTTYQFWLAGARLIRANCDSKTCSRDDDGSGTTAVLRTDPMAIKPQALHTQVADRMRRAIKRGTWPSGSKIPTEIALCSEYQVSRITVRHAVAALRGEGLLDTRQGDGTYVRAALRDPGQRDTIDRAVTHSRTGYTTASSGQWDETEPPSVEHILVQADAAAVLDMLPRDAAIFVERLLTNAAQARLRQTILIPMTQATGTTLATPPHFTTAANAYAELASRHGKIEWHDITSARLPTPDEAEALHVASAQPLLITQRITRTQDTGRPLMLETFAMAGSAVQVSHTVRPTRPAPRT